MMETALSVEQILLIILAVAGVLLLMRALADRANGQLIGRLESLAAAQERQGDRVVEQERALMQRLGETGERLTQQMLDQTRALGEALRQQNERLGAAERTLAEALASQNEKLLRTLNEQARADMEASAAIQERLAVIDAARGNIEALGTQVGHLSAILGNKQTRGAFGEAQLEQIVQDRLPPDAFAFQATLGNGRRADCLIRLPHPPGPVAVDSKFPLESWLALRDAPDDAARVVALRGFRTDVLKHVRDVAERYIIPDETADGAIVFVPSEAIYADLHAALPDVVSEAHRRSVYIVSPTTLWAVLASMRALMRDVRMRTEARKIQAEVQGLVKDVGLLEQRVDKLKRHFEQAQGDIEDIERSTRAIKRHGEKIEAVEVTDAPALPAPK
jgi:DNA recombination protein RmuC